MIYKDFPAATLPSSTTPTITIQSSFLFHCNMLVEQVLSSLPFVGSAKPAAFPQHPLGPLTAAEIKEAARLVRASWPADTKLQFKVITLSEPKKEEAAPYLVAEHAGETPQSIERRAFIAYYIRNTVST
jgi:primary-amine oxidase